MNAVFDIRADIRAPDVGKPNPCPQGMDSYNAALCAASGYSGNRTTRTGFLDCRTTLRAVLPIKAASSEIYKFPL